MNTNNIPTTGLNTPTAKPSLMSQLKHAAITKYLALALLATAPAMQSCDTDTVEPVEQTDPNKLTEEQQAFANTFDATNPKAIAKGMVVPSIIDGTPVIQINIDPVPNNKAFTEAFKGFMDIELRLINAKAGTYSITPIINKSSVAKIFEVTKQIDPTKEKYIVGLSNEAVSKDGVKRDLTAGESITELDDNNPATVSPFLAQLPDRFTMDEFAKYNPFNTYKNKSFTLNKDDIYRLRLGSLTIGVKFEDITQTFDPATLANARLAN